MLRPVSKVTVRYLLHKVKGLKKKYLLLHTQKKINERIFKPGTVMASERTRGLRIRKEKPFHYTYFGMA